MIGDTAYQLITNKWLESTARYQKWCLFTNFWKSYNNRHEVDSGQPRKECYFHPNIVLTGWRFKFELSVDTYTLLNLFYSRFCVCTWKQRILNVFRLKRLFITNKKLLSCVRNNVRLILYSNLLFLLCM